MRLLSFVFVAVALAAIVAPTSASACDQVVQQFVQPAFAPLVVSPLALPYVAAPVAQIQAIPVQAYAAPVQQVVVPQRAFLAQRVVQRVKVVQQVQKVKLQRVRAVRAKAVVAPVVVY